MLSPEQNIFMTETMRAQGKKRSLQAGHYAVAAHHLVYLITSMKEGLNLFSKKLNEVEDYDEACHNAERDYLQQYEPEKIFEKGGRRI